MVQCTLTDMADPPTFFLLVSACFSREKLSSPRGARRGRFCGEVQVGDRVDVRFKGHKGDQ